MIRRLALCTALLLSACSGHPTTAPPSSPAPSPETPKTVEVYEQRPRPAALELPFIRILGEQDANLRWPKAGLHLDLIGAADRLDDAQTKLIGPVRPIDGTELVIAHIGTPPNGTT